jgi:hypothetical protein
VRSKKGFRPTNNRDTYIHKYIYCLKSLANTHSWEFKTKSNISLGQQSAINDLRNDPSSICKDTDKGGAVVIIDKIEMVLKELQKPNFMIN